MAEDRENVLQLHLHYHTPELGISGKAIISKILERRRTRKEATHNVFEKKELLEIIPKLNYNIEEHNINRAVEAIKIMYNDVTQILQNSYNALFEELMVLNEKIARDKKFLRGDATQLTINELNMYEEFLMIIEDTLERARKSYINDAEKAIAGNEVAIAELKTTGVYFFRQFFTPTLVEWWNTRQAVRKTFKLEGKITKLEAKKKITEKTAEEILRENKEYAQYFRWLVDRLFIHSIIAIRRGYEAARIIERAVEDINLPNAYKLYGKRLRETILKEDERGCLKSLYVSINQILEKISEVRDYINRGKQIVSKMQKERVKV